MTSRPLKVYGWQGFRSGRKDRNGCTREIVAATSKAHVGRIVGRPAHQLFNLGETGNAEEIALATSKPGTIFWQWRSPAHEPWTEVKS